MVNLSGIRSANSNPIVTAYRIADPEFQPGLSETVESGVVPVEYLNYYNTSSPVRCAFCGKHQRHNRGFTARMADGRIALCGRDCGKAFFGIDVARQLEKVLKAKEKSAIDKAKMEMAMQQLPLFETELWQVWTKVEEQISDALLIFPRIPGNLVRENTRDNGDLCVYDVIVKDVTYGRNFGKFDEKREVGRVRGFRVLGLDGAFFKKIAELSHQVTHGTTLDRKHVPMKERIKLLSQMPTAVGRGMDYLRAASEFFQPENLRQYAIAFEKYTGESVQIVLRERKIEVVFSGGEVYTRTIPVLSQRPILPDILR